MAKPARPVTLPNALILFSVARMHADVHEEAVLDAGAGGVDFDTEDELAARELPVVADRAAAEAAAAGVGLPAIAAHCADIEAGPVIRRRHHRRRSLGVGPRRHVGGRGRGRDRKGHTS